MLSRCPACATVFRVDTVQIRAREGRVRCGRCSAVFDALDAMVDISTAPPAAPPDITAAPVQAEAEWVTDDSHPEDSRATLNVIDAPEADVRFETAAVTTDLLDITEALVQPAPEPGGSMDALVERTTDFWGAAIASGRGAVQQTSPGADARAAEPDPDVTQPLNMAELRAEFGFEPEPELEPEREPEPEPEAHPEPAPDAAPDGSPGDDDAPPEESANVPADVAQGEAVLTRDPLLDPPPALEPVSDPAMQRIRRELYGDEAAAQHSRLKTSLWALGCVLLALLASGQLIHHFRTDIALAQPALKPLLEDVCARLGCTVPAPREPDKVSIEASELTPETGREPMLRLSALLRNNATFTQAWPNLELTLTDTNDRAVVRRVLAPAEFLPPGAGAAGFEAQSEQPVTLLIDPAASGASGYRLYVFYP